MDNYIYNLHPYVMFLNFFMWDNYINSLLLHGMLRNFSTLDEITKMPPLEESLVIFVSKNIEVILLC